MAATSSLGTETTPNSEPIHFRKTRWEISCRVSIGAPTLITLGRTIRAFRESAGMIQIELAKQLGYTNAWLSNIETGQIRPRQDQLDAIEEILGIPSGVLLTIQKQHDAESLPGHLRPWPGEEWLAACSPQRR